MQSFGLKTHIWNNSLKSALLLTGFPLLMLILIWGFALVIIGLADPDFVQGLRDSLTLVPALVPWAIAISALWFIIAWFAHQKIIDWATGATRVSRESEPRLYRIVENLCISRGMVTPAIAVIETPLLNAFASGIRREHYQVTVTRGLLEHLDDAELEGVVAHELTHIRNLDVRLLVVAAIFCGIISVMGDIILTPFRGGSSSGGSGWGWSWGSGRSRGSSSSSSSDKEKGGGGAFLILIAILIFLLVRLAAIALRLAVSRRREFMADAGAVELTKNPDAMISALRKIEGRSQIEAVPGEIEAMFIDNPSEPGFFARMFATHPPISERVAALVQYAGGHDPGPYQPPEAADEPPAASTDSAPEGSTALPQGTPWAPSGAAASGPWASGPGSSDVPAAGPGSVWDYPSDGAKKS